MAQTSKWKFRSSPSRPSISRNTLSPRAPRFLRDALQFIITRSGEPVPPSFPDSSSLHSPHLPGYAIHSLVTSILSLFPVRSRWCEGSTVIPSGIDSKEGDYLYKLCANRYTSECRFFFRVSSSSFDRNFRVNLIFPLRDRYLVDRMFRW